MTLAGELPPLLGVTSEGFLHSNYIIVESLGQGQFDILMTAVFSFVMRRAGFKVYVFFSSGDHCVVSTDIRGSARTGSQVLGSIEADPAGWKEWQVSRLKWPKSLSD